MRAWGDGVIQVGFQTLVTFTGDLQVSLFFQSCGFEVYRYLLTSISLINFYFSLPYHPFCKSFSLSLCVCVCVGHRSPCYIAPHQQIGDSLCTNFVARLAIPTHNEPGEEGAVRELGPHGAVHQTRLKKIPLPQDSLLHKRAGGINS